ncbi:hypothetical protein HDV00_000026 [Rhizophlyctis rosea]|nr:hypothetical protein HDV00_000026 [Rhizophlyctis rosea]
MASKTTLHSIPADLFYKFAAYLTRIERSRLNRVCRHTHASLDLIALEVARLLALPRTSPEREAVRNNIYGAYPALCRECTSTAGLLAKFLDAGLITKDDPLGLLGDACFLGDVETLKFILATCPSSGLELDYGFEVACQKGHVGILALLIHRLPKSASPNGRWPAHLQKGLSEAASEGHLPVIEYILAQTNLSLATTSTWMPRPLWSAAKNGHTSTVGYLLAQGTPPTIGKNVISANKNTLPIIRLLHAHNWDPREYNDAALEEACNNSYLPVVEELIHYGVPLNARIRYTKGNFNSTPIEVAAYQGNQPLLDLLISLGANTPQYLDTALQAATWNFNPTICQHLLSLGADYVRSGKNPLELKPGHPPEAAKFILTQSQTPIPLPWIQSALTSSVKYNYVELTKTLFQHSALSPETDGVEAMVQSMRWWDPGHVWTCRALMEVGVVVDDALRRIGEEDDPYGKRAEFLRLLSVSEEEVRRAAQERTEKWLTGKRAGRLTR